MLILLSLLTSIAFAAAQEVGQIHDGQIQAPTSTARPKITPAPKIASASVPASIIESAAIVPFNHTHPTIVPSGKIPLHTAKSSVSAHPSGTGGAAAMGGVNATAPTVPAVPSVVGSGTETEAAALPSGTEGPREAGTSKPATAATGGIGKTGVERFFVVGMVVVLGVGGGMW